ncbi:ClpP family protease [Cellulomonas wangsupingiae]|uniref:ATP-dependent Clp protease proteolytic subunit n=1 Tax=Cellulomonas wangsupingiae TaxID=2968085 RepID=A0ABY5JZI4_9CELL|nr:ATP-dependent Clp protease proteolytic subunit [Cellulomonas wangsupingiae]MCC2333410.1 ATP-dependent Clp protease proteolytic subunit [Cellulomonas wangsupingiae]MCM0638264.1 ATP-dependent Clp protease proteolytic subunit [Cellulomonas wangsupingiae]UUI63597.1 ATP-dependent Clp protease proteolytic subunit [Cellulomonas wangsupingiae]
MSTPTSLRPYDDELIARLAYRRIVVLSTALDEHTGHRLAAQLLLLSAEDPRTDVTLWISSPGGSVPAMLAIHDVMRLIPNDVRTVAAGMAASAGQFLLSAGTPGKRFALPHARVLLHQGSAGIGGTAVDVELQADDLRHTRDTVLGLIARHTGQSVERVREDSLRDRWFTAAEALAYGFVDAVADDLAHVLPDTTRHVQVGAGFVGADA